MQRTIATLLLLTWGPAAALMAADAGGAFNPQVARYHVGDLDEGAPANSQVSQAAAAAAAQAAQTAAQRAAATYSALEAARYYGAAQGAGTLPRFQGASYAAATASGPSGAPSCGAGAACGQCQQCCDAYSDAVRFEYLVWWSRGRNVPPLVSTGALNDPDTVILYGDDPIGTDIRNGARITLNHLFVDGVTWGDLRFWGVEDSSETFFIESTGLPGSTVLGRPFTDVNLGPDVNFVAAPGIAEDGSIRVLSKNDLIGADAWLRQNWYCDGCTTVDLLAGYMFTRLDDSIVINSVTTAADPDNQLTFGTTFDITDSFRTQNEFHGGQIGFLATRQRGNNLSVELLAKLALGSMRQSVIISGSQTQTAPTGDTNTINSGLLALPTNIGSQERHRLAVVPEINLNLVYTVNPCWRLMMGYSFIYWSNVVLAGNQIDTTLNLSQLTAGGLDGPARPAFKFQRSDYWVQGLNFGLEYRW